MLLTFVRVPARWALFKAPEGTVENLRYRGLYPSSECLRETRRSVELGGPSVVGL